MTRASLVLRLRKMPAQVRHRMCALGYMLHALYWLVLTDLGLRLLGYERVRARYARLGSPARSFDAALAAQTRRRVRAIVRAARLARTAPLRAVCLQQSLVLYRWLWRVGVQCDLCIGVRKSSEMLAAHAWVEVDGHVLNDTQASVSAFAVLTARGVGTHPAAEASAQASQGPIPAHPATRSS